MKISHFLETVTNQIHSKEAKEYVKAELCQHVQQSKQSWMQRGFSEIEAEEKAVREMGSPMSLGKSLNKLHKPKVDWLLVSLLTVISLLSFLPIMAINQGKYLEFYSLDLTSMIQNKMIFIVMGLLLVVCMMYIDYRKLKRFGYLFYTAGAGLIISLCIFSNKMIDGESMIEIGAFDIQIWMAIPLFLIAWASFFSTATFKLWQGIGLFVVSVFLFLQLSNLPMLYIYIVLVSVLFLQSRFTRNEKMLVVITAALLVVGIIVSSVVSYLKGYIAPYQITRILGFINPDKYPTGSGYLYITLENALRNARFFGSENINYLPEAHTNLVFGNLIQTFGYAMGIVIFIMLAAFLARFWLISRSIKDSFGKLLILGCVTVFATQFLYSIGMTFGLLPLSSIPLPFMSYGLMPIVLNAFIVGIVLSVYRRKHLIQKTIAYQKP